MVVCVYICKSLAILMILIVIIFCLHRSRKESFAGYMLLKRFGGKFAWRDETCEAINTETNRWGRVRVVYDYSIGGLGWRSVRWVVRVCGRIYAGDSTKVTRSEKNSRRQYFIIKFYSGFRVLSEWKHSPI